MSRSDSTFIFLEYVPTNVGRVSARPIPGRVDFTARLIRACMHAGLFMLIYGGCLHLTHGRSDVGRWYSGWELSVPLVPAMIVPYFSIYPLFFLAFFMCAEAPALRTLSRRLITAQLVAGSVYLMCPLQSGFTRPTIDGVFAPLFHVLEATDLPYNLAPSLHVATSIILAPVFCARLSGSGRWMLAIWFALICASTVFTWQHHLVDVASGALLGMLCVRCFSIDRAALVR